MKTHAQLVLLWLIAAIFLSLPGGALGNSQRFEIPIGNSLQKGSAEAPITMVEFLDFQ